MQIMTQAAPFMLKIDFFFNNLRTLTGLKIDILLKYFSFLSPELFENP